jgi:hypothetical protein|nr:MAG TPA: Heat-stable enterotoxin ST [Caudoviricetes sp.]
MKKLLHKLRMWMLRLLNGCPDEMLNDAISIAERDIKKRERAIAYYQDVIRDYKTVVREICRRSEHSYYDWCCEYCCVPRCDKRNGWCAAFAPKEFTKR